MSKKLIDAWVDLGSDVSWEDYGGRWARKAPDGSWYVVIFDNMREHDEDAVENGSCDEYMVDVRRVDLIALGPQIAGALRSIGCKMVRRPVEEAPAGSAIDVGGGHLITDPDIIERCIVDACVVVGYGAPLDSWTSDRKPEVLRNKALRAANAYMKDDAALSDRLARPVNAIGSTAAEYGAGDLDVALNRPATSPQGAEVKNLMRHLHGLPPLQVVE